MSCYTIQVGWLMKGPGIGQYIQQSAQWMLDLIFPPRCAGCQHSGYILCPTCMASMQAATSPLCQHCHGRLASDGLCSSCRYRPLQLSGLRAFGHYQDVLRASIHALKYDGCTRLAPLLGQLLQQAYCAYRLHADVIVPVPLHSERQQQRGYNHATLLARVLSQATGVPLNENMLIRQRSTSAQVGLRLQERQRNVEGAFRCTAVTMGALPAKLHILLVDDVCTTGATLEACAAPLFAAGASSVWGLVLARP